MSSFSSASTLVTETINGSHDFKITGYSLNKGIGVGEYISSETFTVGCCSWRIDFCPNEFRNHDETTDAYVSIYVTLTNARDWVVKAQCEIALLDQSGDEKRVWRTGIRSFITDQRWGNDKFLKQKELEADYLKDDCLHIRCRLGVASTRTEVREIYPIPLPPSDISQCFGRLLESGEESDVIFEVDGENFFAHKLVLGTRSPVFKAQFFGSMKDQDANSIKVEDMEAPIFKVLLHFIYWDALPDLKELNETNSKKESTLMFQHLLVAADRYHIDRLSMICAAKLYDDIAIDTVATTLALAEQHNCLPLKLACLKFIALPENLQAVRNTDAFKSLKESRSNAYIELVEHVAGWNRINEQKQDKKGTRGCDGILGLNSFGCHCCLM